MHSRVRCWVPLEQEAEHELQLDHSFQLPSTEWPKEGKQAECENLSLWKEPRSESLWPLPTRDRGGETKPEPQSFKEGRDYQKKFGQLWQQGPSEASNSPIGCKCGNISIFMFHTLPNTIKVETVGIPHSDMKVQTNNIANHNTTPHQRAWLIFSLSTLKGSLHYCDISHLRPSGLF